MSRRGHRGFAGGGHDDSGLVVTLKVSELRGLLREEVERLADLREAGGAVETREWLTQKDVADLLGRTETTIRKYVRDHGLPVRRLPGGAPRFRRGEVEDWLRRQARCGDLVVLRTGKEIG